MSNISANHQLVEKYDAAAANLPMETNLIKMLSNKDQIFLYYDQFTGTPHFVKIVNIPKRIELQRVEFDGKPETHEVKKYKQNVWLGIEKRDKNNNAILKSRRIEEHKHLFLNFDDNRNKLYPFPTVSEKKPPVEEPLEEPPVDEPPVEEEEDEDGLPPTSEKSVLEEEPHEGGGKKKRHKTKKSNSKSNRKNKKNKKSKRKATRRRKLSRKNRL